MTNVRDKPKPMDKLCQCKLYANWQNQVSPPAPLMVVPNIGRIPLHEGHSFCRSLTDNLSCRTTRILVGAVGAAFQSRVSHGGNCSSSRVTNTGPRKDRIPIGAYYRETGGEMNRCPDRASRMAGIKSTAILDLTT